MKKYFFPYLLVLGGLALMLIYNWQFVVGVVLMLVGGYMWKMTRDAEKQTPDPNQKK